MLRPGSLSPDTHTGSVAHDIVQRWALEDLEGIAHEIDSDGDGNVIIDGVCVADAIAPELPAEWDDELRIQAIHEVSRLLTDDWDAALAYNGLLRQLDKLLDEMAHSPDGGFRVRAVKDLQAKTGNLPREEAITERARELALADVVAWKTAVDAKAEEAQAYVKSMDGLGLS